MVTTKVAFRKFDDGDVIAIFTETRKKHVRGLDLHVTYDSYMHIGQHAPCCARLMDELEMCAADEYAPLLNELEAIGYKVEVVD